MKKMISFLAAALIASPAMAWQVKDNTDTTAYPGIVKLSVDVSPFSSQLDVLFVVDNSGSMTEHQKNLSANIDRLLGGLTKFDVQAAVVTTDMSGGAVRQGGRFVGGIVSSRTPDFLAHLKTNIMVGIDGSAIEQLFAPVIAALTPPLSSGENAGFLRPHSQLSVIFVSDAEDQSQMSPEDFIKSLEAIRPANKISMAALYTPSGVPDSVCRRDTGEPLRLEQVLTHFKAQGVSLCDGDLGARLDEVGAGLRRGVSRDGQERLVSLPLVPALDTVRVRFGSTEVVRGDYTQGWFYDTSRNAILIAKGFDFSTQPLDTKLEIEYVPVDWQ